MMTTQACPNCGLQHDIRVYVSGQKVACRCGIRFEARRGDVAGGSRAPGLSGISSSASRVEAASRTTVVPGGSGVTVERGSGVLAAVMSSTEAGGSVLPGVAMANTVVPDEEAGPRNGVAVLPGVAAPPAEAGGVAPPSAAVTPDGVGATVVRSSVATSSGSDHSNVDVHAVDTLVAGAKVDLPGFELLEMLGRGGMGEVWLARQQSLGRTVAVKLLPPRLAKDPEFVTRFEKEATALAALNHPHIIQIIDRGVAGEHYFFVMEYVEGRSLREAMTSRALTPQQGLKLMLSVARAIECAHDKGIIHRDLKPENILLDGRGHVKVADFGLAGIRQPDSRLQLTATAVAMGTLNYMAPEQRRDAKSVDGRADLFSLGVILYEMLTGELPLGRFKLPSAKVPGLDPRVDAVVERLLETEPASRYAHAGELCAALEAMVASTSAPGLTQGELDGRPVPAGAKAASQVSRRLRLGWRRVRGGLSVVGGLAVLGLGVRLLTGAGREAASEPVRDGPWPPNTYGEVFAAVNLVPPAKPGDKPRFEVNFEPGQEEINVHSGQWTLKDGQLRAVQGGKQTDGQRLVPRAYVAHRYFSTNDFNSEVVMNVSPLGKEYGKEADAQHYGELAFRIKDLQVSAFAIPDAGMRLAWRYYTENGQEVVGNSALDTDNLVGDEMPLPEHGPYLVRLQLRKVKGGVMAEAFLNNERFAHKLLPGLEDRVGKVALGCRNLVCTFDDLKVRGTLEARPQRRVAGGAE